MKIVNTGVLFGVLGPVVVRLPSGNRVAIDEPRRRAVMAALLVNAGRTVTWHQLHGLVWGDAKPASSRKSLQVYVSKIRQAIAAVPEVVVRTQPDGYQLTCPVAAVDLHVFRRLVTASRRVSDDRLRCDLLRDALTLWRGAPFTDVSAGGLREWVAPRLEEERLTAIEEWYAARIRLGEHGSVIEPLNAMMAEHPLRERVVELLMSALHLCGKHTDATRVYHQLRISLVREMGIEPNRTLTAFHQAILAGTAAGSRSATLPAASLIGQGRALLAQGDHDRALASLYSARAEARDNGDKASLLVATEIISAFGQVPRPQNQGP